MADDPIADLILRVAVRDRAAFRLLYSQTSSKLMGVLLRILATRTEAEDALQEVFTRVWLRAARYDAMKGRGMTWLISIARNHAIDRLRARPEDVKALARDEDDLDPMEHVADTAPTAETRMIAAGEARRIAVCFDMLPPDRAEAVRGAYLNGLSYVELAERHDVPLNTMRTWLRRSLLRLKECLGA